MAVRMVIENGLVLDPENRIQSRLHLILEDGKVAALTRESPEGDLRRLDAAGKIVCPGFLDIHMHEAPAEELQNLEHSIFGCMLRMGVTTALGGNCGENVLPPPVYFEKAAGGLPVNLCMMAGHGSAREAAGFQDKYATLNGAQIAKVREVLAQWLEAGCFGISYGIRYYPGMNRQELMETAQLCQREHLLVSAHVRDDAAYIFASIDEFLEAGWNYGLKMQVSHLGSMGGYGQMAQVLAQLDEARLHGLDVMADCYPYSAFSTQIGETTYDPGFLERYQCDYDAIVLCDGPYQGQRCTKEIFEILRRDYPETITVAHVMQPEDVAMAMAHPAVMLCSDGLMHSRQGHPRAAGTFPRLIAEYVREGSLSLYDAVEKMTALPARRLGLKKKGNLAPGSDADVVIFDPETIRDRATFETPDLPPEGIDYVFVNGEIACDHGVLVQDRLGRVLKRQAI